MRLVTRNTYYVFGAKVDGSNRRLISASKTKASEVWTDHRRGISFDEQNILSCTFSCLVRMLLLLGATVCKKGCYIGRSAIAFELAEKLEIISNPVSWL